MLLDIFVTVPTLLMTTIAWYICVGLLLICLIMPSRSRSALSAFTEAAQIGYQRSYGHRPRTSAAA